MHKITFFPLGNADCCRIDTSNGKIFLFDYANRRDPKDNQDKRIDLFAELKKDLQAAKRDSYDVVAFTHLDDDHICGAPDFFFLEHAEKYQSKDRAKIGQMWVPAPDSYTRSRWAKSRIPGAAVIFEPASFKVEKFNCRPWFRKRIGATILSVRNRPKEPLHKFQIHSQLG